MLDTHAETHMVSRSQGKTTTDVAAQRSDTSSRDAARAVRREIARQLASEAPDANAIGEAFERLRDLTERPDRLFAIDVAEAAALTTVFESVRTASAFGAAVESHRRVIERSHEGANRAGLEASRAALERLLRVREATKATAIQRHFARMSIATAWAACGEPARALAAFERIQRDTIDLPTRGGVRAAARDTLCEQAFECAIAGDDLQSALRWGVRLADLRAADRNAQRSGAYADALAPLPSLSLAVGAVERACEQAHAWIAAERVALAAEAPRGAQLISALEAASRITAIIASRADATPDDHARALESARVHTDEALGSVQRASDETRMFARARALEAVAHEIEAVGHLPAVAVTRLADLAMHARTLGEPGLETRAHLARLARAVADGDWANMAPLVDTVLAGDVIERNVLAVAVRAHFAAGDDSRAIALARAYLDPLDDAIDPAECAAVLALAAAASFPLDDPSVTELERDAAASAAMTFVHALAARVHAIKRLDRDASLQAAILAARALAESSAGLSGLAKRDAQNALSRLRAARMIALETALFVQWVHEIASADSARRRVSLASLDLPSLAARALAAAQRGDTDRAAEILSTIPADSLNEQPESLAHALAALIITLEAMSPADPSLDAGRAAWEVMASFATLPAARSIDPDRRAPARDEIAVDASESVSER